MERDWDVIAHAVRLVEIAEATTEWREGKGFETNWRNFSEKLMLVMTEVSEAADAAHSATEVLGLLLAPRSIMEIEGYAKTLAIHAKNYVEEWVDVMVRVFDMAGACNIPLRIEPPPEKETKALPLAEVFDARADIHVVEALRHGTGAMEVFRDIKLMCCDDKGAVKPEDGSQVEAMSKWMSGLLSTAAWAIDGLGENWRDHYARKMWRNEGRPERHGRER